MITNFQCQNPPRHAWFVRLRGFARRNASRCSSTCNTGRCTCLPISCTLSPACLTPCRATPHGLRRSCFLRCSPKR